MVHRYLAYQNMHCPLQVPVSYEVSPSVIENAHARLEDAMAHALGDTEHLSFYTCVCTCVCVCVCVCVYMCLCGCVKVRSVSE